MRRLLCTRLVCRLWSRHTIRHWRPVAASARASRPNCSRARGRTRCWRPSAPPRRSHYPPPLRRPQFPPPHRRPLYPRRPPNSVWISTCGWSSKRISSAICAARRRSCSSRCRGATRGSRPSRPIPSTPSARPASSASGCTSMWTSTASASSTPITTCTCGTRGSRTKCCGAWKRGT